MFVVGSVDQLGRWLPQNAIEMSIDKDDPFLWITKIELDKDQLNEKIRFRYFTGYYLLSECNSNGRIVIVSLWESHIRPRRFSLKLDEINGIINVNGTHEFGVHEGKLLINHGWLVNKEQSEIYLRLHGEALKFFKVHHKNKSYYIKVTPFDLRYKEEYSYMSSDKLIPYWRQSSFYVKITDSIDEESVLQDNDKEILPQFPTFSNTDVAIISSDSPEYNDQPVSGLLFNNRDDYFVFRTTTSSVDNLAFRFDFFIKADNIVNAIQKNPTHPGYHRLATAICMPSSIIGTIGDVIVPILAPNQIPIGQITIDYLLINPINNTDQYQSMEFTYARYWKKRKTVEIGHRGMGNSYTKKAVARENTVFSLEKAYKNGADFVEFDVQLTKDKIPIVYHDFHVKVHVSKKKCDYLNAESLTRNSSSSSINSLSGLMKKDDDSSEIDYHVLAIKDLKLKQLRLLHVEHKESTADGSTQVVEMCDEDEDKRPFPTLIDTLEKVNTDVGFNIEIKYPLLLKDGTHECKYYFERNEFIDIILQDIFDYAKERRIVFSSFDPDMCTIISQKQNKYPVLFLCVGETTRYTPFVDIRSTTSDNGVNFAYSSKILGVNFHSEDLLRNPEPKYRGDNFGLVSFVWGDDLNNKENVDYFKNVLNVDGVIYDRIGENEPRQNVFLVAKEARKALLSRSGTPCVSKRHSLNTVTNNEEPPEIEDVIKSMEIMMRRQSQKER
ncbi:Glycerophosphocholine phosphodiesterase GPCPD1 [Strongyloides ratti]|uniref:Glycerophosphocholine phosphodiesterase GPCPD1 n=1 Tax=Strongyloides ratti TaxID=34506 RepID=A0A090MV18_STRRB|nr:Glycerophosphocholine phosphodiesterase GPCPD1 [Strongyloides ratti]CEF62588.1 Glycerophosphocholine phosphodiesterase GPCPD1 [Strongyloides ratti]